MKIAPDKIMHIIAGALASAVALLLGLSTVDAIGAAAAAGLVKEMYDLGHRDTHTPDIWDAIATAAGGAGLVALLVVVVPHRLDHRGIVRGVEVAVRDHTGQLHAQAQHLGFQPANLITVDLGGVAQVAVDRRLSPAADPEQREQHRARRGVGGLPAFEGAHRHA